MATKKRNGAAAPPVDDTHRIAAYSLRMPPELRVAIEAELDGFNRGREIGSKARTLNDELVVRLASTLAVAPSSEKPRAYPATQGTRRRRRATKAGGK